MLLRRRTAALLLPHLRPFSAAAAVAVADDPFSPDPTSLFAPLTYLPGFPIPDAKHKETIVAVPRAKSGSILATKERRAGRVPAIVFDAVGGEDGGNKRIISVQTKQIRKLVDHLGYSFFLSRLFDLEIRSGADEDAEIVEKVRVLPRLLHLHAGTDAPLNVTFIRAPSNALLKVDVPLVFIGDDVCPGLRKGANLNTIQRTVKYLCPPDIIPPYIEVDLSELDVGERITMGDLKVHPALKLCRPAEFPVCNLHGSRGSALALDAKKEASEAKKAAPEAKKAPAPEAKKAAAPDAKKATPEAKKTK